MADMTVSQFYKILSAVLGLVLVYISIHNFVKKNKQEEKDNADKKIETAIKAGLLPITIEITKLNGFIEGVLKTTSELKESDSNQTQAIVTMREDIARHESDIRTLFKTTNNLQKLHME